MKIYIFISGSHVLLGIRDSISEVVRRTFFALGKEHGIDYIGVQDRIG